MREATHKTPPAEARERKGLNGETRMTFEASWSCEVSRGGYRLLASERNEHQLVLGAPA